MGPGKSLVHISSGMMVFFSYLGINIPLSYLSRRKKTVMLMCLTLVVTHLSSARDKQQVLSSQFTVGDTVGRTI